MARRLERIDARIAEVEKLRQAEDAREQRILEAAAATYGKQEEAGLRGL